MWRFSHQLLLYSTHGEQPVVAHLFANPASSKGSSSRMAWAPSRAVITARSSPPTDTAQHEADNTSRIVIGFLCSVLKEVTKMCLRVGCIMKLCAPTNSMGPTTLVLSMVCLRQVSTNASDQ